MRKFILIAFILCVTNLAYGATLRASVSKSEIPEGFFGTWHVTSKLVETNNRELFNTLCVDIWTLGGYGSTLILENNESGATSSITVDSSKNIDGKTLTFNRYKENYRGDIKIVQKESPTFTLNGNLFTGYDTFIIERYKGDKLIQKDVVKYKVVGQKISE